MKVYTRAGDQGQTRIIGGQVVSKDDLRVEAYGEMDHLNSLVGYIASQVSTDSALYTDLLQIQQYLFDGGNDLARPLDQVDQYRLTAAATQWLEDLIDHYNELTPELDHFILPGGSPLAGLLHILRTSTRSCERRIVSFQGQVEPSNPEVLRFVNRLSDYCFVMARYANVQAGVADVAYERSGQVFRTAKRR